MLMDGCGETTTMEPTTTKEDSTTTDTTTTTTTAKTTTSTSTTTTSTTTTTTTTSTFLLLKLYLICLDSDDYMFYINYSYTNKNEKTCNLILSGISTFFFSETCDIQNR